jgi:hypothetical protein
MVPVLIDGCKKAPKESFWEKVKAEVKKLEKSYIIPKISPSLFFKEGVKAITEENSFEKFEK